MKYISALLLTVVCGLAAAQAVPPGTPPVCPGSPDSWICQVVREPPPHVAEK